MIPRRQLGQGGPEVGAIGLGCMSFGGIFGPTNEAESFACLDAALKAGITLWDTANIYGMGISETVLGRYLAAQRPQVVLATKAAIVPGPPRRFDNSASHLRTELEGSLARLGVDRVDLFYIHRREAERPIETVVESLMPLIEEGLIGGYGLSEIAPASLRRAHAIHPCRAVQNEYSLATRLPELGVLQACAELGVAFVPFSPLARGLLGDPPVTLEAMAPDDWRRQIPRFQEPNFTANRAAIERFAAFCAARGWTTSATALAWILARWPHAIPIPGTRSAAHLNHWLTASDIRFTAADLAEIERLLPPGFAHGDRYNDDQSLQVERYC